jgi:hypothetical protein
MVNDFYLILTRFATSWSNHELNCVFNHFILDQFSLIVVETWHSPSPRSSKWRVNPVFCLHFGYSIFMTLLTSFDDFTWIWWFFTFPDFFLLTIFFIMDFILIYLDFWYVVLPQRKYVYTYRQKYHIPGNYT